MIVGIIVLALVMRYTAYVSTQADQVDQLISAKVDAIIIVPVEANSLSPQITQAKAKKIPVLAVNTTLKNSSDLAATVLPDDVKAGQQEMEMMADELGGKGNIVILQGPSARPPSWTAPRASRTC